MKRRCAAIVGLLVLTLGSCSSDGDSGSSPGEGQNASPDSADATAVAKDLKGASSTATKVVTITEDNDPNNLIGRPNGYETAAIIYDSEVSCDSVGSDCGVAIETFADQESAEARAQYIQGILKESPALGSEWDYVNGSVLVRVSGNLKPSSASNYADAFGGEEVKVGQ